MKILISDKLSEEGIKIFQNNGFEVDKNFTITPEDLAEGIKKYDAIVVRSRTKLTKKILENAKNLIKSAINDLEIKIRGITKGIKFS